MRRTLLLSAILLGGTMAAQAARQTATLETSKGTMVVELFPTQAPRARESMGMAFDELHQQTVVFGGKNGNTLLNDTWVLQTQ